MKELLSSRHCEPEAKQSRKYCDDTLKQQPHWIASGRALAMTCIKSRARLISPEKLPADHREAVHRSDVYAGQSPIETAHEAESTPLFPA